MPFFVGFRKKNGPYRHQRQKMGIPSRRMRIDFGGGIVPVDIIFKYSKKALQIQISEVFFSLIFI